MLVSSVLSSDLTLARIKQLDKRSNHLTRTKFLQYYSSYSLSCILCPCGLFYNWRLYLLTSFPSFASQSSPLAGTCLSSVSMSLFLFVCFVISVSSVQSLSRVLHFVTPWTAAHQVSLLITNSRSLLKLTSIESVMPSNHLILRPPLLLLPSVFPRIGVFSNESVLHIRWPKYWSFRVSPSKDIQD